MKIIEKYPQNKIVILPQTVFYTDDFILKKECALLSDHSRLTICVRDKRSYDLLKMSTSNQILLIPDMAFYISDEYLNKYRECVFWGQKLYLRRIDKEMDFSTILDDLRGFDIRDWPSLERRPICLLILRIMKRAAYYLQKITCLTVLQRFVNRLADEYAIRIVRPYLLKRGCDFISPYSEVITTRLHGLILSILFHKPVYYINNTQYPFHHLLVNHHVILKHHFQPVYAIHQYS